MSSNFSVDVIGIGSGKCGSTWFFENLVQHPEFFDKNPKEINYFSDLYEQHPFSWYESQFSGCPAEQKKGEFSVTYMYRPESAQRIKERFPDAKIIAIVRDPIRRTFSDYLHFLRKGDLSQDTPFSSYIADTEKLDFGKYHNYLQPFFDIFPAEQIKVLVLEEFSQDYGKGFREVYEFIGVNNPSFLAEGVEERRNTAKSYRFLFLENLLVRTYRVLAKAGHTRFAEAIKKTGIPEILRKLNTTAEPLPEMDSQSRQQLIDYFGPANSKLGEMIGKDLRNFWEH